MKTILVFILCITTVQSLIAQDTVRLKSGKVAEGKIISIGNGIIALLTAKDTVKYPAADVCALMFCNDNKNCSCGDTNSSEASTTVIRRNSKDDPCNCMGKQNESADKSWSDPSKYKKKKVLTSE